MVLEGIVRLLLAVMVAAVVLVALHQGFVIAGRDRDGALGRFAAGTCSACHGGGAAW